MTVKAILVLCAQALLVKSVFSQACGYAAPVLASPCGLAASELVAPWAGFGAAGLATPYSLASRGLGYDAIIGAPAMEFSPTSGGGLPVTSGSAIAPVGISVMSDNAYEGILQVIGELPFVGTVAMEGALPTVGGGAINHACGNGVNAMVSENAGFVPAAPIGVPPYSSYGYPAGWPGAFAPSVDTGFFNYQRGCGCGSNIGYVL